MSLAGMRDQEVCLVVVVKTYLIKISRERFYYFNNNNTITFITFCELPNIIKYKTTTDKLHNNYYTQHTISTCLGWRKRRKTHQKTYCLFTYHDVGGHRS